MGKLILIILILSSKLYSQDPPVLKLLDRIELDEKPSSHVTTFQDPGGYYIFISRDTFYTPIYNGKKYHPLNSYEYPKGVYNDHLYSRGHNKLYRKSLSDLNNNKSEVVIESTGEGVLHLDTVLGKIYLSDYWEGSGTSIMIYDEDFNYEKTVTPLGERKFFDDMQAHFKNDTCLHISFKRDNSDDEIVVYDIVLDSIFNLAVPQYVFRNWNRVQGFYGSSILIKQESILMLYDYKTGEELDLFVLPSPKTDYIILNRDETIYCIDGNKNILFKLFVSDSSIEMDNDLPGFLCNVDGYAYDIAQFDDRVFVSSSFKTGRGYMKKLYYANLVNGEYAGNGFRELEFGEDATMIEYFEDFNRIVLFYFDHIDIYEISKNFLYSDCNSFTVVSSDDYMELDYDPSYKTKEHFYRHCLLNSGDFNLYTVMFYEGAHCSPIIQIRSEQHDAIIDELTIVQECASETSYHRSETFITSDSSFTKEIYVKANAIDNEGQYIPDSLDHFIRKEHYVITPEGRFELVRKELNKINSFPE